MIRPQPGPQERFLATPADIAIFGGAAGGGKSYGLLLEALRHIGNPNFGGVIFRRTFPQIRNEGGLWDTANELYSQVGGKPKETTLEFTFPTGASVRFAHLNYEADKYDWQGAQVPFFGWDELTHFTEGQFFYMLSRNRSLCGVRPYIRATTNPDADSWVAELLAWWIDQETGLPIKSRAGVLRWFVRVNDDLVWADSADELVGRYPEIPPKSLTFIPARLQDNAILMREDPGYLANLLAQTPVERGRLLDGNWKIRATAGKVFNRGWFEIVDAAPAGGATCRFWDFASTAKSLAKDDPDFTAGVKMSLVDGVYTVLDCFAEQLGPVAAETIMRNLSRQDAVEAGRVRSNYRVRWELEPGAAAIRYNRQLVTQLAGLDAGGKHSQGDKLIRAKPLAAQAQAGNVKLVRGAWNETWLRHMHGQPDLAHDDIMDASAGAFNDLVTGATAQKARSYHGGAN